jgi:predicted nucleic acid-binding protein
VSVYAESSAVPAWLLDEDSASDVRRLLGAADVVVASDLTLIECDRVLLRAVTLGELREAEAADRRAHLVAAASHWHTLRIAPEIVDRARQPFPGEPIRTLDAIHLASALTARAAVAGLKLLSLDDRIRRSGSRLGLPIVPQ